MAPPKPADAAPPTLEGKPTAQRPKTAGGAESADAGAIAKKKRVVLIVAGAAAVVVLGGVLFFAYKFFLAPAPPPPAPAVKAKAPAAPAAKAPAPKAAPTAPAPPPPAAPAAKAPATPSATLNEIAQIPAKAITKAKGVIEARQASGQSNVEPVLGGQDLASRPATPSAAPAPAPQPATGVTPLGKGVSATTPLAAAMEASAEFRSFVANARVSGVFQGTPSRAMINGRLVRAGELVDASLGIRFEGVDAEKRHLLFKDRSGALVARKY